MLIYRYKQKQHGLGNLGTSVTVILKYNITDIGLTPATYIGNICWKHQSTKFFDKTRHLSALTSRSFIEVLKKKSGIASTIATQVTRSSIYISHANVAGTSN